MFKSPLQSWGRSPWPKVQISHLLVISETQLDREQLPLELNFLWPGSTSSDSRNSEGYVLVYGCQCHKGNRWCLRRLTCRGETGGGSDPFSAWRSSPAVLVSVLKVVLRSLHLQAALCSVKSVSQDCLHLTVWQWLIWLIQVTASPWQSVCLFIASNAALRRYPLEARSVWEISWPSSPLITWSSFGMQLCGQTRRSTRSAPTLSKSSKTSITRPLVPSSSTAA